MLAIQARVIGMLIGRVVEDIGNAAKDYIAPALVIGLGIAMLSNVISNCRSRTRPSNSGMFTHRDRDIDNDQLSAVSDMAPVSGFVS